MVVRPGAAFGSGSAPDDQGGQREAGDPLSEPPVRWRGPSGLLVRLVENSPSHRLWAAFRHVDPGGTREIFLISRDGALVTYAAGIDDLARVVDLATLAPEG